jgi:N-acetylneuraminate synthase
MLIHRFRLPTVKISSGDLTNAPLLAQIARSGTKIILSTGMSTLSEIEEALSVLAFGYTASNGIPSSHAFREAYCTKEGQQRLRDNVVLLHCTSEYPAAYEDVNLRMMDTLKAAFGLPVGLSDHTIGIAVAIASVARGATLIEKHFTLDSNMPGPDHRASLEPDELMKMVKGIRQVESALGFAVKIPVPAEYNNKDIVRKSIVASHDIRKGEPFSALNVTVKRPGTGLSPMRFWELIGLPASKDYQKDEVIQERC